MSSLNLSNIFTPLKQMYVKQLRRPKGDLNLNYPQLLKKNDRLESWQKEHHCPVEQIDKHLGTVDQKTNALDKAFQMLEKDV